MGDLDVIVAQVEAFVQRLQLALRGGQQDFLAKNLQQHFAETLEFHDGAVVLLHELLDGEVVLGRGEAEEGCDLFLVVEQQAVLAAPGDAVQREAHPPQVALAGVEQAVLGLGDELVVDQFAQRLRAEMPFRDPADDLYITQAARAFLDIGFEIVGGVVVAQVAVMLFLELGLEKLA
jgi:hypothetical protein